jgi:HEAT repeat protein
VRVVTRSAESARTQEVFATLIRLLDEPDPEVRAALAAAIGALGADAPAELREGLGRLILDRNETVLREVAAAVCRLGRLAAMPKLLDGIAFLLSRPEGALLLPAVGALGTAAGVPVILRRLAGRFHSSPEAFTIAQSLGRGALRQTLAHFAGLFRHPVRRVRNEAVHAAMNLRSALAVPDFLDEVVKLLRDEKADTRASAAAAVEVMGPAASTPTIREALHALSDDPDSYVRYKVEQALGAIDSDAGR